MDRKLFRVRSASSDPHTLVMATPAPRRRWGALVVAMAVLAGMIVGVIWLSRLDLGSLELAPEDPTEEQDQTAQALTDTVTPAPTQPATAAVPAVVPFGSPLPPDIVMPNAEDLRNVDLRTVVAPPTATPTRTPVPPLESLDAVVGSGGATLWDETGGQVARVQQGTLLTVDAQSTDGNWLHAVTPAGETGWVTADALIVFNAARLRREDVVIIPITPTPAGVAAVTPGATAAGTTPAAPVADATASAASVAVPDDAPTARVAADGSRLNVRAGPGPGYPILAKAQPGETLILLGQDTTGDWLQVAVPVSGGFGWVSADFVETEAALEDLPVVTDVNDADPQATPPPAGEGDKEMGMAPAGPARGGAPPHPGAMFQAADQAGPILRPTATPKRSRRGSATGLHGKLVIQKNWGGSIYVYDLETGELRLLTGGFDPALSPDGRTVAFTRAGGEHGLYLIDVDGSNERLIFSGREMLRSPKFSPDGRYIVFERGDERILCREQNETTCLHNTPANDNLPLGEEVQEKLAFVDINGQNYQDLPVLDRARAPDWSTGGIVYQSPAGIQRTDAAPGIRSELVYFKISKQYELDPDWQPGGGRVIFQRREASHWEIYSVNPDGSDLQALTMPDFTLVEELPSNVSPAWSYDGRHIVFLSNRVPDSTGLGYTAGPWSVWVMNADGSNQRRLPIDIDFTYTFVQEQMLDWGP